MLREIEIWLSDLTVTPVTTHCVVLAGYCFLLFQDELSVQALVEACSVDESKLYWCVSSPTMKDKPVCSHH